MRGPITQNTVKRLFARSGGVCAFPDCKVRLVDQASGALLGEMCHISAAAEGGPRFDPAMSNEERNDEANLIILCPTHHSLIDQDQLNYPASCLKEIKANHEARVANLVSSGVPDVADSHTVDLLRQVQSQTVDFAIVVALKKEMAALRHYFPELAHSTVEPGSTRSYYTASIPIAAGGHYRIVATLLHDMGNLSAAQATAELIQRWNPRYVLVVGIAGGLDRRKQNLGDIAVSESVLYYEIAKVRDDGVARRAKHFVADRTLLDGFLNLDDQAWRMRLPSRPDGRPAGGSLPAIHIGPIASGEKIVASVAEADSIRAVQPNVIAIEMESAGVASASFSALKKIGFITVRAICDFADNQKNDNWQDYAANAAASCLRAFLDCRPVAFSEGTWPEHAPTHSIPNRLELRKQLFADLCAAVDLEDFKNFCFVLGVDPDELPGEKKSSRVRELILLFERRGQIDVLQLAFSDFRALEKPR